MSIVPISDQQSSISSPFSTDIWNPFKNFPQEFPFSRDFLDWDPFADFPFPFHFPSFSREVFPSLESQVSWRETQKAHVYRAFLPGLTKDQVIVFIDDDKMLQISSDDGKFMSKFKLPESAITDQVKASMDHGMLTVTVAKEIAPRSNVRVVEITG
ncbi:hypothetical protein Dsin_003429 [Dipteronia sinensis]|uniref:SHSP domain-containing protein n=1 Tax=Dipteronia sinensis TaxID=43782 RepID=A0AAE0EK82_9ROSI|nr:hypothetical protein Dsin_003429 [Dipteronia sinensis]